MIEYLLQPVHQVRALGGLAETLGRIIYNQMGTRPDERQLAAGEVMRQTTVAHGLYVTLGTRCALRALAEGGEPGTAHSWRRAEIVSFDEAFRRELVEFGDCIATGRQPRTSGADGLRDMRAAEAIARVSAAAVSRGRRSSGTASGA